MVLRSADLQVGVGVVPSLMMTLCSGQVALECLTDGESTIAARLVDAINMVREIHEAFHSALLK